jgi:hypothetical protein
MGKANFQPKWWTEKHASQWENLKTALERDWEQTKADLHLGGHELKQKLTDTLKQAAGAEPAPPASVPNSVGTTKGSDLTWDYAEPPLRYGVGAREQYGAKHAQWNDDLETTLKNDWETSESSAKAKWEDVKALVRHGFDRARR